MAEPAPQPDHEGTIVYRAHHRGLRYGFRVGGKAPHDSGPIYNDEVHVRVAILKFNEVQNKNGSPVRGSNVSQNRRGELGRRALRRLTERNVRRDSYIIGARI